MKQKQRNRRDYGSGGVYQRCERRYGCPDLVPGPPDENGEPTKPIRPPHTCHGRWSGSIEVGWNANGTRRRVTVSAKTEAEAKRRLRKKQKEIDTSGTADVSTRTTVKQWAEQYLELRKLPPNPLSPNGWNASASPIRKWIIPTIGHKRLSALTPADVRAVAKAQYDAGRKTSTADATQRVMMTMLNYAIAEGHMIPERVMKVGKPGMGVSDRLDVPLDQALACLAVASTLPHGVRWLLTLLYGARQGETNGLVEYDPIDGSPCIDFENKVIRLAWQLQDLQCEHGCAAEGKQPTCGKKRPASCPKAYYRIPRDYEAVQVKGMYHLVRPKSKKGIRVLPMLPAVEDALREWLAVRPENPLGLVFPTVKGTPTNDANDREEWHAIQCTAGVGHPGGRWWHIHECRNLAATQLDEAGASDNVITSLLGHASILTSRGYMTAHLDAKRDAVAKVAERLQLGPTTLSA